MFRGRSIAATLAPSSPSQFSGVSAVALLCCVFLAAVPIERVACMSLDRLGIDRNEIQNEKQQEDYKNGSDVVVDDRELAAVPAVGNTDVYVLMPAGSVSDLENVDKNTIENVRRDEESSNAMEDGSDMVMMESNDAPVMQIVQMPESLVDQDQYKTVSIAGKMEPEEEMKNNEVPAEEYSGDEVFPQDITKENEDTAAKGTETDEQNEVLDNLSDMLKETAINEEELPLEMAGSAPLDSAPAATTNDEHLDNESVFEFFPDAVEAVENVVKLDSPSENFDVEKDKIEEFVSLDIAEQGFEPEAIAENVHVAAPADTVPEAQNVVAAETAVDTADLIADSLPEDTDDSAIREELAEKAEDIRPDAVAQQSIETMESENVPEIITSNEIKTEVEVHNEDAEEPSEPINGERLEAAPVLEEDHTVNEQMVQDALMQDIVLPEKEQFYEVQTNNEQIQEPEEQSEEMPMQIPVMNQEVLDDKIESEEVPTVDAEEGYKVEQGPPKQDKQENEIEQVEESSVMKQDIVQTNEEQKSEQGEGIDVLMAENLNQMQDVSASDNGQKESNTSEVEIQAAADTENMPMESIQSVAVEDKIEASPIAVDELLPEEEDKDEAASNAVDEPMPEEEDKIEAEPVAAIEPMLQEEDKIEAEPVAAIEPMLQEDKMEAASIDVDEPLPEEEDKIEAEPIAVIEPMLQEDKMEAASIDVDEPLPEEEDKIEAEPIAVIEPMLQEDKMEAASIAVDEPMPEEEDKIEAQPIAAIEPMLQEEDKMEAASIAVNEPLLEEQAIDLQPAEVQEETKPVEIEPDNEVPAQIILADEPEEDNLDKVVAEITEPAALVEQAVDDRMPEEMQVNEQKVTLIDEMENAQANAAEDLNSNSILTTIVQVPQVELQAPQQTAPLQSEQVQTTAEESSAPAEVHNENEAAVPAPQEPAQVATESSTQRPFNVADSVLNYVNASFSQQTHDNKASPSPQQQQLDDGEYSSQLRRYDGAQVWRVVVQSDRDRKLADELQAKYDGQLWKEVKQEVDYLLKPQVLADAELFLRSANLSRIVLIDNLQKVIEVENPPADQIAQLQNRKGHRLTWQAYHRLEDIHGFFDYLAKTYPDICSVETIGYSIQKRPLKILKISNGNKGNPGIWIDGGMHAREWISPASVTYIANEIVEGWDDLPAYMKNINWYIHAVANPDGYEYSHTTDRLWRKNLRSHGRQCPGVDLNRNFGYKWGGKGTSANPCSQTYRGNKAFSEPETFYISKFISNYPRDTFQAYLTFHSYGQYILYPWGYDYALTNDRADLDRVARQAGTSITRSTGGKYTVGSSALTLYPAAGGSDDWAKGFAGIKYAYTIEMADTGRYGFVLPASHIEPNGKDGYTFVETVARAVTQTKGSRRRAL